jgi:geranylgeranyl diphosphate synthase type II
MSSMIESRLLEYNATVTAYINKVIEGYDAPKDIKEACAYSINAGGKRIRPALFLMTLEAFEKTAGDKDTAFASSLEMIHTYSLIHDDLPAMDNDDYRRGKLTSHKVFGEAMAILAGDALLNMAFETMLKNSASKNDIRAMYEIAKASGCSGMVGGQVLDMNCSATVKDIMHMYALKTGALFKASVLSAAILAGCGKNKLKHLDDYTMHLGIAFQLRDDIIDRTKINPITGRPKNSDEKNNKSTYISRRGLENSKKMLHEHTQKAIDALKTFPKSFDILRECALYLDDRSN